MIYDDKTFYLSTKTHKIKLSEVIDYYLDTSIVKPTDLRRKFNPNFLMIYYPEILNLGVELEPIKLTTVGWNILIHEEKMYFSKTREYFTIPAYKLNNEKIDFINQYIILYLRWEKDIDVFRLRKYTFQKMRLRGITKFKYMIDYKFYMFIHY